jgi:hypothetical protein
VYRLIVMKHLGEFTQVERLPAHGAFLKMLGLVRYDDILAFAFDAFTSH